MINKSIKKQVEEYFQKKEFSKAIDTILELGHDELVNYAKANKWFRKDDFCIDLCKNDNLFTKVFSLDYSDDLLHDYFNYANFSDEFEKKLAEVFPDIFIKAVRVNQVFLKPNQFDFLASLNLPEKYKPHQKVWKFLKEIDFNLWNTIDTQINKLSRYSTTKVLNELIVWLENQRFENPQQFEIQYLSSIYSFFIKLYLSKYPPDNDIKADSFTLNFLKQIKEKPIEGMSDLLNTISQWINFNDSILSAYSFDLKIQPDIENNIIYFRTKPQDFYKWKLDGARYGLNRLNYFFKGVALVDSLTDKNALIIPGRTPEDREKNRKLAVQDWQLNIFLDDLKLNSLVFKGREIDSQLLFKPLTAYSFNRNIKYEQGLQQHIHNSKTWIEAYLKLFMDSGRNENFPFLYLSTEEYIKRNNEVLYQLPKDSSEDIINLFSYRVLSKYKFDRFNIDYNVWHKPFIQIGEYLFCPMMFFANNDWFYGFAQAGLENLSKKPAQKIRKESATEMENYLGKLLKQKNWNVKVFSDKEAGLIDGDVDIAISNSNITLLIQLKRTKFRLNLQEAYFEHINSDRKASKQLNNAENFFRKNNSLLKMSNKVYKWIVSTSFEGVLTNVNNCLKINYFDLINAIKNPNIKQLEELIAYCENDVKLREWNEMLYDKEMPTLIKFVITEAGLPLSIIEPKVYNQAIFVDDNNFLEYNNKLNKAIELGQKGSNEKAIRLLNSCLSENPNDYEVWSELGNLYADIKDFNKSLKSFEKALEIIPNDPSIMRNYAIANREAGNNDKWKSVAEKLQIEYWFLPLRQNE